MISGDWSSDVCSSDLVAYEWDQPRGERNTNALLLQAVAGF